MEVLATALFLGGEAVAIDERTTRKLIEDPKVVRERLMNKLHVPIDMNTENIKKLQKEIGNLHVLRSVELVTMAYEIGLLKKYFLEGQQKPVADLKKAVLEGALWGVKLNGCAVKTEEIEKIIKLER